MTVFVPDLAITVATNEALNATASLWAATSPGNAPIPLDLTGASFICQVRQGSTLILNPTVQITDAKNGGINIYAPLSVMQTLSPQSAVYDLIYTPFGGDPDNLLQAPFFVVQGVSQ